MQYPLGQNRLIYQAPRFTTGMTITVSMYSPGLVKSGPFLLTEFEEGFYYFDFNFDEFGPWIGVFYENGEKVLSHVFRAGVSQPGIIRYVS